MSGRRPRSVSWGWKPAAEPYATSFSGGWPGENGVIATAHTLSDLAETVLLHLTRGTGLKGLCGIPPVRENIVRPLIDCSRREIEDYCREHKIPYVTDSTNLEARYSRNKVRLQVLPALKEINPAFEEAVGRMAQSLREDDGCLCEEARELLGRAALEKGGWSCSVLSRGRKPVRIRAIRLLQGASRPEARHLEEIDRIILAGQGGVSVPGGLDFHANRGVLRTVPHKKRKIPQ